MLQTARIPAISGFLSDVNGRMAERWLVNGAPICGSERMVAQKARRVAGHEVDNGSGSSEGASADEWRRHLSSFVSM